ncbi:right-handed parallel beta-helix repeat-containing protein [Petrotoga sp. 9PWA.NaAc.5.4]|uniref:right-handed parallel beta-helix repeat-containing protein n=1 Tax=Petrotoga sp. 9PWA.NaAc.5.4 TaxID=1434328 RepID=UPI000CB0067A|nr:right-handed parallel beta-helix repeat-containing protein [Petrotoga sp. 9PWA.NaAc.5.4]PNR94324.1 membrane protein [Petrotoga sp. 9PWA.NaAc.5.4]
MEYHVAKNGSDHGEGTQQDPFLTINKAAFIAMPGDTIIVHEGIYREWVKPKNKGLSNKRRIVYQAAKGEKVVIKGSERIQNWQHVEKNIWKCELPNSFFGNFNPYKEKIFGDWLVTIEQTKHLGDVYLNGMSFYEVGSYEELINPTIRTEVLDHWTQKNVPVLNPEQTQYVWFTEVDNDKTTIYANFHGANPNEELVEINVRRSCFYPIDVGIDYITVKGFEMAHAATPWAPPTADQPGLIGANWSKGWIIEENIIHDAKCSAISIGKEASTGHLYRSIRKDKPGYQYQLESVFSAEHKGWSKESIGSHIIRNNVIYDCGQNAIVGHLGCVFSEIHHNHIYNIGIKREFYGHEIAGIKLHAAIDVQIHHNRIHNCSLGLWLDWQAQGTRVSKNLFYQNNRDLFVEVSHGPYVIDHNILASENAIVNMSQGGAYINNLICGKIEHRKVLNRFTPYHLPHSTKVAGYACVYGGDDRFYNNIFVGKKGLEDVGTSLYNGYTSSLEEYIEKVHEKYGDLETFASIEQPVYINNNVYFNGAQPFEKEKCKLVVKDMELKLSIIDNGKEVFLSCVLPDNLENMQGKIHSTTTLERVRIVDVEFDCPNGKDLILDEDFFDDRKSEKSMIGPIASLKKGENYIKVW